MRSVYALDRNGFIRACVAIEKVRAFKNAADQRILFLAPGVFLSLGLVQGREILRTRFEIRADLEDA